MTAKRVYIIIRRDYETGIPGFSGVFFSREAAENDIAECRHPDDYEIEVYEEMEDGNAREIY